MSFFKSVTVLATAAATIASAASKTYTVTIKNSWTAAKFPQDYPTGNLSAHWSPMNVALTNKASGVISPGTGEMASAGLQLMAETGNPEILQFELEANRNQVSGAEVGSHKTEGMLVQMGADPAMGELTFDVETDVTKFKYLELAAMIAPSPDWFGFVSVDLSTVSVGVMASGNAMGYDAGTKNGNTYTPAGNATEPQGTIQTLNSLNYLSFGDPSDNVVFTVTVFAVVGPGCCSYEQNQSNEANTTAAPEESTTAAPEENTTATPSTDSAAGAIASLVTGAALLLSMAL